MTSMFWGLRMEPGKRYSTTVDKSFHVSMAALDCTTVKNDKEVHSVMLEEGESNIPFILCNLQKPKVIQAPLNLNFVSGDRITFFCRGNGTIHLTGYCLSEDDDDDFAAFGEEVEEEEEEDEEEEEEGGEDQDEEVKSKAKQNGIAAKRKGVQSSTAQKKKQKLEALEQGESEDDSDEDIEEEEDDDDDEGEELEDESMDEEEADESDEENETEEAVKVPEKAPKQEQIKQQQEQQKKRKKNKKNKSNAEVQQSPGQQQPKQKQQNVPNGLAQSPGQQQKKKQANDDKSGESAPVGGKKALEGGVIVKDLKVGNGQVCKPGKMISVYYTGKLKANNKVFDQTTQGPGFKFRVGRGEVIKGWDVGLNGMKVGGRRLIICPPNMAYGQKGSPPTIPGNSTLMFEVELKAVN